MHPLRIAALVAALCASAAAGTAAEAQTTDPNAPPAATQPPAVTDTVPTPPGRNRLVFVMLGPTLPVGTINDYAKGGFGVAAGAAWRTPANPLDFRIEGHFHALAIDAPAGSRNVTTSGSHRIAGALASAILEFGVDSSMVVNFRPYVTGGIGFMNVSGDATNRTTATPSVQTFGDNDGTDFAFAVGGGARMNFFGLPALLEARVIAVRSPTPIAMVPVAVALEF